MFISRMGKELWPAKDVTLKTYPQGDLVQNFHSENSLREYLSDRPRTTYLLQGRTLAATALPPNYQLAANDILTGEIYFDPDTRAIHDSR